MREWHAYLRPISPPALVQDTLSTATAFHGEGAFPQLEGNAYWIGIPWLRKGKKLVYAPLDKFRSALYRLICPSTTFRAVDLGDIEGEGLAPEEVYDRIAIITEFFVRQGKILLFVGGSQDFSYGIYKGFVQLREIPFSYVLLDSALDIEGADSKAHEHFNRWILELEPAFPTWIYALGLQYHKIPLKQRELMEDLGVIGVRLRELLWEPTLAEPALRMADCISIDLSVIRAADAPAVISPNPAGLTIELGCQILRMGGMGYGKSVLHLANYFSLRDKSGITAQSLALLAWYYLEGLVSRYNDFPSPNRSNLIAKQVTLPMAQGAITFYQHPESHRWWMEVQGRLVPCHEEHLRQAQRGEVPDLWYSAQKYLLPPY
ncbi:MAG: arginase family protein [Bacteroidia bacterium]